MSPVPGRLLAGLLCLLVAQTASSSEPLANLLASGRPEQVKPQQQQQQQQQQVAALPRDSNGVIAPLFSAIQTQAQRQMSQLNGLVLGPAPNLTVSSGQQVGSVLEALSNVGKAIQQQIMNGPANPANRFVSIVTSPNANGEPGTSKKNEYQSIVVNDGQQLNFADKGSPAGNQQIPVAIGATNTTNYPREQSEQLRQEIIKRASQLQQVVASSMEVLKNNGDLIVRRLLEQLNIRLDQAKSKADKIINEPATTDVALKALNTINSGLNNLNNIITNIVNRLDLNSKDGQLQQLPAVANLNGATQRVASNANALLEAAKSRLNLHQLGQQFSSALNAVQQQQRQQQLLQQASNNQHSQQYPQLGDSSPNKKSI